MTKMFIAGEPTGSSSGQTYDVINPANGEMVDSAPKGNENDARAAIDAAYHAKYDRYGPQIVGSVVGSAVEAVTIKLVPRS